MGCGCSNARGEETTRLLPRDIYPFNTSFDIKDVKNAPKPIIMESKDLTAKPHISKFLIEFYKKNISSEDVWKKPPELFFSLSFKREEDCDSNILYNQDGLIKAATVDKLIEKIIFSENEEEREDAKNLFIFTFPTFMTNGELLDKFASIFLKNLKNEQVLERISLIVEKWIDYHFRDLDNEVLGKLIKFLSLSDLPCLDNAKKLLEEKIRNKPKKVKIENAPEPEIPEDFDENQPFDFMQWSPTELARQLTLIEHEYWKKIEIKEFLKENYSMKNMDKRAPNISLLVHRFNQIGLWIMKLILDEKDLERRADILMNIIELLEELATLRNFSTLMAIFCGLQNSSIYRLKDTWATISEDHEEAFKLCEELCSAAQKSKNLRDAIDAMEIPCIPHLGLFISDFYHIDTSNHEMIQNLLNINKRRYATKIISKIRKLQEGTYQLKEIKYLKRVLSSDIFDHLLTEEELYEKSLEIEPKK